MPPVPYTKTAIPPATPTPEERAAQAAAASARLLDTFVRRLVMLGATADEIEAVRAGWDVFDEDWTPDYRLQLATASDALLRGHLVAIRREHVDALRTDEEALLARLEGLEDTAKREAQDHAAGPVAAVLAWVKGAGTEEEYLARSFAVCVLEENTEGRRRKGVLDVLRPFAEDWDDKVRAAMAAAGVGDLEAAEPLEPDDGPPPLEVEEVEP